MIQMNLQENTPTWLIISTVVTHYGKAMRVKEAKALNIFMIHNWIHCITVFINSCMIARHYKNELNSKFSIGIAIDVNITLKWTWF